MIRLIAPATLVALAIWLLGCASTEIRDPSTGNVVLRTQGDTGAVGVLVNSTGMQLTIGSLLHSIPTAAGGAAAAKILQGSSNLATGIGSAITGVRITR